MKWNDIYDIAVALSEKHPGIDPRRILFTDLHNFVIELEDFKDNPKHGGEKILESIQMAWIEEVE